MTKSVNPDPVRLPYALTNYHRITLDVNPPDEKSVRASTRVGRALQKVVSVFAYYFPRLSSLFVKKSEPVSVLVKVDDNREVYALLDHVQPYMHSSHLELEKSLELDFFNYLPIVQTKLALVRTDIKVLKTAREEIASGSLESSLLSESYRVLIEKLERIEIDLVNALFDLDEQNKTTYVKDLRHVKELQFPGYPAGFLDVSEEQVGQYLNILENTMESGQVEPSAVFVPLFINLDAFTRIVDIWNKNSAFKEASGFSDAQIQLIVGFVTKAKSLIVMKNLVLNSELLFLREHEIKNLIEKVKTNSKSLLETEKRTLQLLLLILPELETFTKTQNARLIQIDAKSRKLLPNLVEALKIYACNTLEVNTDTSFNDFVHNWQKEFPALENIGELQGHNTLFEIYYTLQNSFKGLSNGEKVQRMLTERASIQMTSSNLIAEKTTSTIEVDGKSVVIPDEFEAYISNDSMRLMINGQIYPATDVVETYKMLRDFATTDGATDEALLQALLLLSGLSSSPISSDTTLIVRNLIGQGNDELYFWESFDPSERFVHFNKGNDGLIHVTLHHTSLIIDGSGQEELKIQTWDSGLHYKNDTFVDRKIQFKETFTLGRVGNVYVKKDISSTVECDEVTKEQIATEFVDRMPTIPTSLQRSNDVADQFFAYLFSAQVPRNEETAAYFAKLQKYLIDIDNKKSPLNAFAFVHDIIESWKEKPELLREFPDKIKAGIILAIYLYTNQEFSDETITLLETLGDQVGFDPSFGEGKIVPFKLFERLNRIVNLCNKSERHEIEELRELMEDLKKTNSGYYARFKAVLFSMPASQFSAQANHVIFAEEAEQYREGGMTILRQVVEHASQLPLDDTRIEPALNQIMERAVQDPDKVNIEVRKDLGHRNNDKSFYIDKKGKKSVIDRTDEESFHRTLSSAMGVKEEDLNAPWLKPMGRFYSQLIPNFFLRQAIEDFSMISSEQPSTELFGLQSYYQMSPDHSEITVRELDDNRREVICRDYFVVKVSNDRENAGVILQGPKEGEYFEQRVIIEKTVSESGEIKYVAHNYSRFLYDSQGKQIYKDIKKDVEVQKLALEEIVAGLSYRSSFEKPEERKEKELRYAKIIAELSTYPTFSSVMTRDIYRKLTEGFSQEAMDVAFGHLASGYKQDALAVRDQYIEAFRKDYRENFNSSGMEEDLTSTTQKAAQALGWLPDDVVTDLHRKGENEEFFEDQHHNIFQITGKNEDDFHASLTNALGLNSKWLKPVSRYYSQLIPNKLTFDLMAQASVVGSSRTNYKNVFGVPSSFLTSHKRSVITVRNIDDTHMEVICRDQFTMKLAESSLGRGIMIPEGDVYSEQRVILEMVNPENDIPTFKASEYSLKVFDAEHKLLLDSENI